MLGYEGINTAITNNGMEASWNQMKIATRPIGYVLHVHEFLQALFWHLSDKTNSCATEIRKDPEPDPFRSLPRPSPNQWHALQMWTRKVLESITIIKGNADKWRDFVKEIKKEWSLSDRLLSVITRLFTNLTFKNFSKTMILSLVGLFQYNSLVLITARRTARKVLSRGCQSPCRPVL